MRGEECLVSFLVHRCVCFLDGAAIARRRGPQKRTGFLVQTSVHTKRFSVNAQDGSPVNGQRRESYLYSPGPRPPRVRYADGKVRAWTVELDDEYERAAAAQRVVQRTNDLIARITARKTKPLTDQDYKDIAQCLHDGYKALKVVQSRP